MGPASKTSQNTSSSRKRKVDAFVKFEPKKMVKKEMKGGGNREQTKYKTKQALVESR